MVFTTNITQITANTTLSGNFDVYIINAAGGSITVTLPSITCDGIQYKLKRSDTTATSTVTLTGTGGQTIDGLTSITILPASICEVQSFNSQWFLISNSTIQRSNAKALFTAAFIQNNGTPNVTFSGTATDQIVCSFFYPGANVEAISRITFVLGASGGNPNGTARITTQAGALIASAAFNLTVLTAVALITTTITTANLPTAAAVLEYRVNFAGNNNKLDVHSLTIQ